MTTLSIDSGIGMADSVAPTGTMPVGSTFGMSSPEPLASGHQAAASAFMSAMAKPLMDNAMLGEVLQSLIDGLDVTVAMLPTMSAESASPVMSAPAATVAMVDVPAQFVAAADEVAAAVLVSPELARGEAGEIRVQLRPDVLEGAEIVVAVDGKKMEVTFVPTVTHVADTLASNQSVVQQQLAARIRGFEISVGVAQTVATNVAVNVGLERAAQLAADRMRKTNGRT